MCNPYVNQLQFRKSDFDKIPNNSYGIYGIWFRNDVSTLVKPSFNHFGRVSISIGTGHTTLSCDSGFLLRDHS